MNSYLRAKTKNSWNSNRRLSAIRSRRNSNNSSISDTQPNLPQNYNRTTIRLLDSTAYSFFLFENKALKTKCSASPTRKRAIFEILKNRYYSPPSNHLRIEARKASVTSKNCSIINKLCQVHPCIVLNQINLKLPIINGNKIRICLPHTPDLIK